MTKTLQRQDIGTIIEGLEARMRKLEKSGPGTMTWTDPVSGNSVVIGQLPSGIFGIQVGQITIDVAAQVAIFHNGGGTAVVNIGKLPDGTYGILNAGSAET